ncbi:MAG: DUF1080 domain-containing protein [Bacteroidota bacterium]
MIRYFFTILASLFILSSCREKPKEPTSPVSENTNVDESGFVTIFDGATLNGWKGDPVYWHAENGILVGEITPQTLLKSNTFLIWKEELHDFELKAEFKISEKGNSGINYRSTILDSVPFALRGYQADIDGQHRYTGQNYEERKRATLAYRGERVEIVARENSISKESLRANIKQNAWQSREVLESLGTADSLRTVIHDDDWNQCHMIIQGNRLKHYVNGILMSEVIDNDTLNRSLSGFLGLQAHRGPPMKVMYRNILLKKL